MRRSRFTKTTVTRSAPASDNGPSYLRGTATQTPNSRASLPLPPLSSTHTTSNRRTMSQANHPHVLITTILLSLPLHSRADLRDEMQQASSALIPALAQAESLIREGQHDQANRDILAVFPEQSRTPAQALVLGNVLFTQDYQASYALHQRAARDLPDDPIAQFEWALQQHRAKEFAPAAETYAKFLKTTPEHAPAWGLLSE